MTAQIIDIATRKVTSVGSVATEPRPTYSVHIYPAQDGFDWDLDTDEHLTEDQIASDLAAIALSLRPPPRTFFERLKFLFTGDEQ